MSTGPDMSCPVCKGKMLRRTNKSTGQAFWGCADFPNCRGTRDTDGMSASERHERQQERDSEEGALGDGRYAFDPPDLPSGRARNNDRRRW